MKTRDIIVLSIATQLFLLPVVWYEGYQRGIKKGVTSCPKGTNVTIIESDKGRKICVGEKPTSFAAVLPKVIVKTPRILTANH